MAVLRLFLLMWTSLVPCENLVLVYDMLEPKMAQRFFMIGLPIRKVSAAVVGCLGSLIYIATCLRVLPTKQPLSLSQLNYSEWFITSRVILNRLIIWHGGRT